MLAFKNNTPLTRFTCIASVRKNADAIAPEVACANGLMVDRKIAAQALGQGGLSRTRCYSTLLNVSFVSFYPPKSWRFW